MKKVLVFLADGFEECEGLLVVDILRRAGMEVTTASVMGRRQVTSTHNIVLFADVLAEDADILSYDAVVLPGGIPGTPNLAACSVVTDACVQFAEQGRLWRRFVPRRASWAVWAFCVGSALPFIPVWRKRWQARRRCGMKKSWWMAI